MAAGYYGYDPQELRSKHVGEIAADLQGRGISLDRDTILKYLREAAEFCPPPDKK